MGERKTQKNFIDQIKGKKKIQKKSIGVYKYLVHHAFSDVIINAYPEFYKIIQNQKLHKKFDKSLYKFMQTKAYSPYIWEMPNEYRKFLKKSNFFKKLKYINDLLHFEYTELFLFMQKELLSKKHTFEMSKKYKVSKNTTIHKYNYDVINQNFDKKEQIFVLGYFDKDLNEVVYRPLNNLLYSFLKSIDKNESLNVNLRLFLKNNKISYKDHAKDFKYVLNELYNKKVLI